MEWLIVVVVVGLIYKLSKLRVLHLEFGERDEKPTISKNKRKQLKK